jgi:hypothetical protein
MQERVKRFSLDTRLCVVETRFEHAGKVTNPCPFRESTCSRSDRDQARLFYKPENSSITTLQGNNVDSKS